MAGDATPAYLLAGRDAADPDFDPAMPLIATSATRSARVLPVGHGARAAAGVPRPAGAIEQYLDDPLPRRPRPADAQAAPALALRPQPVRRAARALPPALPRRAVASPRVPRPADRPNDPARPCHRPAGVASHRSYPRLPHRNPTPWSTARHRRWPPSSGWSGGATDLPLFERLSQIDTATGRPARCSTGPSNWRRSTPGSARSSAAERSTALRPRRRGSAAGVDRPVPPTRAVTRSRASSGGRRPRRPRRVPAYGSPGSRRRGPRRPARPTPHAAPPRRRTARRPGRSERPGEPHRGTTRVRPRKRLRLDIARPSGSRTVGAPTTSTPRHRCGPSAGPAPAAGSPSRRTPPGGAGEPESLATTVRTPEVPRPGHAFELGARRPRLDGDQRLAAGIDLVGRRGEDDVLALPLAELEIRLERARVALEVLAGRELRGPTKMRHHRAAADALPGHPDQAGVSFVQGAHRRHQRDRGIGAPWRCGRVRELLACGREERR